MSKIATAVLASEEGLNRRRPGEKQPIWQELKELRKKLGLNQREFADRFGMSLASIHTWESPAKVGNPDLSARLLIDMIKVDADAVAVLVTKAKLHKLHQESLLEEA